MRITCSIKVGNKLLKDKSVVRKEQSQNAQQTHNEKKDSLESDFSLTIKGYNFLLHAMLQTKVFLQVEGRILKKVTIC